MPITETHTLEKELQTYWAKLPEWTAEEGKYVLIKGDDVIGLFTAYEDAIKAGYDRFHLEPFLVKQIHAIEKVHFISRLVHPSTCLT